MKSAEEFCKAIKQGRSPWPALSSLDPYQLEYFARIPINVFRASQELGLSFFPVPRFGRFAGTDLLLPRATNDLIQLKLWARWRPNWALATGSVSGVFALMVDGQDGQASLLSYLGDDWSFLDSLRTAAGQRRFILHPWPRGLRQHEGSLWIGKGLRVLGDGDWLLMPPSRHGGIQHVYLNPEPSLVPCASRLNKLIFRPAYESDPLQPIVADNVACIPVPHTT